MKSPYRIVFCAGANLILIQWVLVREITTLLLGTELVVLLVSVSYFFGISVGYGLSGRISPRWLPVWGGLTLVVHLSLPISFRVMVAGVASQGIYWAAFLLLPLLTPLIVSAFYSIFLPQFADSGAAEVGGLYFVEVTGSMLGIGILVLFGDNGLQLVFTIYALVLLILLWTLGLSRRVVGGLAIASAVWLLVLPQVDQWSNARWYQALLGFPDGTKVVYSGYSPYQKVDVVEMPIGDRALYLDGLSHFNGAYGIRLNIIIGKVPTDLIAPDNALVIGAGVMQTEQLIASTGAHVTTVELDPMVADVGERYFLPYNQMDHLPNRTVVVDDAKHFIANTSQRYDLIIGDTPAAFSIQTATLYSVPFYQSIEDHLTEDGIFVGNMTSVFVADDVISRRVAASLLAVFDEVMVVTPASVGWSFAFAADDLPFTHAELEAALRANNELQFSLFDTAAVRVITDDAPTITLDSMDFVLQTSFEWIEDRLHWR